MPLDDVLSAEQNKNPSTTSTSSGLSYALSSATNPTKTSLAVDASLLRRTLRLIHCMQKERGHSCAYWSSSGNYERCNVRTATSTEDSFSVQMNAARRDSDAAMRLFQQCCVQTEDVPTEKTLNKIRNLVDSNTRDGEPESFHRILCMFNSLISSVVHRYILPHVERFSPRRQKHSPSILHRRAHSSSMERAYAPLGISPPAFMLSNALPNHHAPQEESGMKRSDSSPNFPSILSPNSNSPESAMSPPSSIPPTTPQAQKVSFLTDSSPEETMKARKNSLLSLLGCFVRLKESTGVERATLSSIMAEERSRADKKQQHGIVKQRMLNDLVLEVENQHRLVKELRSTGDESLLPIMALVQSSVEYGPQMAALQQKILSDFDLGGFQQDTTTTEFWELITVYIDRLHSLELLIMEEIECCLQYETNQEQGLLSSSSSNDEDKATVEKGYAGNKSRLSPDVWAAELLDESDSTSAQQVRDRIQNMSPEQVKEKVLALLARQNDPDNANVASEKALPSDKIEKGEESTDRGDPQRDGSTLPTELSDLDMASKEWEINLYELQFQKRIGRGSAGTTYKATWRGQTVAVKVATVTDMGLQGWKSEVQSLQRLHHPNIIRLLGSVYNQSPLTYCLVLEYCDAGDLESALHEPTCPNFFFHVSTSISNGMAYLHSRGVIHRDIKPGNVLLQGDVLNGSFMVKVTDFGVATTFHEEGPGHGERTAETGTYRWMAPEVIRHESYSNKADVYSFGCLVWQLLTRENPFQDHSQIEAAGMVALEGRRPPFPDGTPQAIFHLISNFWNEDPESRLPFDKISESLREVDAALSPKEKTWLEAPRGHPVYRKEVIEIKDRPPRPPANKGKQPVPLVTPVSTMKEPRSEKKSLRNIFSKKKGK